MNANSHFSYIEVSAYCGYNLVYFCHSLLEQQIELVLISQPNIVTKLNVLWIKSTVSWLIVNKKSFLF